jgi:hypothetical protein
MVVMKHREKFSNKANHIIRSGIAMSGLGFLLIVPDLIKTLQREIIAYKEEMQNVKKRAEAKHINN